LRSGQSFHRRVSLDVIKMRMARYDHFDVLDVEPQLLDVRHDDVVHLVGARVVEYVALRSRDQIRAILAAHPINVADDAEPFGRRRLILSLNGFHASRSAERCHNPDRCTEQHQCTDLTHKTSLNLSWGASEALPSSVNLNRPSKHNPRRKSSPVALWMALRSLKWGSQWTEYCNKLTFRSHGRTQAVDSTR